MDLTKHSDASLRWVTVALLWASLAALAGCGGSGSNSQSGSGALTGNWQFQLSNDGSYTGGPAGGFFLQNGGSTTGSLTYSVLAPAINSTVPCAGGVAQVTGTVNGQNVSLTITAGSQTFTLTGTMGSGAGGSTMSGTYTSTAGANMQISGGGTAPCGAAQSGMSWTATSVPSVTGTVQGDFHSTIGVFAGQDFPISGSLTEGPNIGAANATLTGTILTPGYPCFSSASLNGTISGTSVILQVVAPNGLEVGTIGFNSNGNGASLPAVVQQGASNSTLVTAFSPSGYAITNSACPTPGSGAGDKGNACFALGGASGCTEPITLSPIGLTFPAQVLGTPPSAQTITVTNTDPSGAIQNPTLTWSAQASDYSGLPNFSEQDNCGSSPFSLATGQSCTITITFTPQQSCPRSPIVDGTTFVAPVKCPSLLPTPTLTVAASQDAMGGNPTFAAAITGTGLSDIVPSFGEVDFGAVAVGEQTPAQNVTFTNQSPLPVQILPAIAGVTCVEPAMPPMAGVVPGLQVIDFSNAVNPNVPACDSETSSGLPNFQLSADTCSGTTLASQESCSVNVSFAVQPGLAGFNFLGSGVPRYLQLNTLECTGTTTAFCEIDSGRVPVELTANTGSPLRMSPGAGINFGSQSIGSPSAVQTITIYNDPADPKADTVTFVGIGATSTTGDYSQTNTCGSSLASGSSCTINVTFTPSKKGFDPGTVTITPLPGTTAIQVISLWGNGK